MNKKQYKREKNCYCHTCEKYFHYLGINRHRAMHRDKKECCKITFTHGNTVIYKFDEKDAEKVLFKANITLAFMKEGRLAKIDESMKAFINGVKF